MKYVASKKKEGLGIWQKEEKDMLGKILLMWKNCKEGITVHIKNSNKKSGQKKFSLKMWKIKGQLIMEEGLQNSW